MEEFTRWLRGLRDLRAKSFLESPEEIADYLGACIEEANCDAAFIAKAL
jgi:DNA-binding phage protein